MYVFCGKRISSYYYLYNCVKNWSINYLIKIWLISNKNQPNNLCILIGFTGKHIWYVLIYITFNKSRDDLWDIVKYLFRKSGPVFKLKNGFCGELDTDGT